MLHLSDLVPALAILHDAPCRKLLLCGHRVILACVLCGRTRVIIVSVLFGRRTSPGGSYHQVKVVIVPDLVVLVYFERSRSSQTLRKKRILTTQTLATILVHLFRRSLHHISGTEWYVVRTTSIVINTPCRQQMSWTTAAANNNSETQRTLNCHSVCQQADLLSK